MNADQQIAASASAAHAESRALQAFAVVAGVMASTILVFWQTSASMVEIWARSDTFNHCFFVVPAVLWFVWRSRYELARTEAGPSWWGLAALIGCGLLWLMGELASALAPTQWAMIMFVPAIVLALFGWGWLRVLAFPLAFLTFAVPFGEVFVPVLIDWTADFTVAALRATGVPVFREGQHFVIPSGRWSVVEACSGIRYLIASTFVGALYAWTMYRSPRRRALFIGASILVPIVANWVRAYLIVMIGHLSGNRLAVGVDHLLYGWLFFGVVMGLMFWIGARWREDDDDSGRHLADRPDAAVALSTARMRPSVSMIALVVVLVVAWPAVRGVLLASVDDRPLQPAPISASAGWVESSAVAASWQPLLDGVVRTQVASFSRDGAIVSVFIGYYRGQKQGSELVNSMNRFVPEKEADWHQIDRGRAEVRFGGGPEFVHAASLRGPAGRLRVLQWYWLDDRVETSDVRAKLSLAIDRVLLRSDTSAWVAVFTAAETDASADRVLAAFTRDMGPALQHAIATTAAH